MRRIPVVPNTVIHCTQLMGRTYSAKTDYFRGNLLRMNTGNRAKIFTNAPNEREWNEMNIIINHIYL